MVRISWHNIPSTGQEFKIYWLYYFQYIFQSLLHSLSGYFKITQLVAYISPMEFPEGKECVHWP